MTAAGGRVRPWRAVGPGLVFALTVVGPGDLVANVAAGASHGYGLLWVLPVALAFRFVWLSTSARYVLVTGETLVAGFARYGRWSLWLTLGSLVVIRHMSNLTKVLLMGGAAHALLPLPTPYSMSIWGAGFALAAYAFMARGGYGPVERLCKVLAVAFGVSLVAAAVAARPSVGSVLQGLFVPSAPADVGLYSTLLLVTALIGTESGSLTNITYSYFVIEKGWRGAGDLRAQRFDLAIGVGALLVAAVVLQAAAAATLHGTATSVESVDDLSRLLSTTFGRAGVLVFAAGLLGKTFAGFVGGTTGYALLAGDIVGRLGREPEAAATAAVDRRHDRTYQSWLAILALSPLYVVFTSWQPVILALLASAAMAGLIPLLAVGLLVLGNDKRLGPHANRWPANLLIVLLAIIAIALTGANALRFLGIGS